MCGLTSDSPTRRQGSVGESHSYCLGGKDLPDFQVLQGIAILDADPLSVLPHDTYRPDFGLFIDDKLPFILWINVAGVVQKGWPDVVEYKVGDYVFGEAFNGYPTPDMTGLQEYGILEVEAIDFVSQRENFFSGSLPSFGIWNSAAV